LEQWIDLGPDQFDLAIARMRQSPAYAETFPGMQRADGSLRFRDENEYLATIDSYTQSILSTGVNPDLFRERFVDLLEGDVSPAEFASRVDAIQSRVLLRSEEVKADFLRDVGFEITDAALIAVALNPDLDDEILNQRITVAEISAEATLRGFEGLDLGITQELFQRNFDRAGAADLFGQAQQLVPVLDRLAERHLDVDDDFDLADFIDGFAFGDPIQQQRARRVLNTEAAAFQPGTLGQLGQAGEVTGLEEL